jgi:hypothetical protein
MGRGEMHRGFSGESSDREGKTILKGVFNGQDRRASTGLN